MTASPVTQPPAASGGAPVTFPGYASGLFYAVTDGPIQAGNSSIVNAVNLVPIQIKAPVTITQLGARVSTVSSGGNFMLGLYAHNPVTGRPTGLPVAQVVGLSTATAGVVMGALAAPVTLQPGIYWVAAEADNNTCRFTAPAPTNTQSAELGGAATVANIFSAAGGSGLNYFTTANTYGSFPDVTNQTLGEYGNLAAVPALIFKVQ